MISTRIVGIEHLRDATRDLKSSPARLRRELTQGLRNAAAPVRKDIQRAIETLPMRGQPVPGAKRRFRQKRPGTQIRHRIARVVEVDVTTSSAGPRARFVVRSDRLGNARNVPYHLDQGRLRHPVMGDRSVWANVWGQPWFYKTVRDDRPKFETEADEACRRTVEAVERGNV